MLLGKRTRKMVAATLLTIFATDTFAPGISYALTSGPAAPEASNFEPVDTTDMVNLQTGDLTYNIPLLEVPGPEGGYPLALSYHSDIQPNVDASWVGLGWSLNPGAITRDVNGYPDDYSNIKMTRRDFWNGGSTTVYQVGVNIGLVGSPASVSVGLSLASDTYKGFGIGLDAGIGASYGPLGIQLSVGLNPYGGAYASLSPMIGFGIPIGSNLSLSAVGSASISTDFKTVDAGLSASGGLSYSSVSSGSDKPMTHPLLGASISSTGTKPSLSVGGITASAGNSKAGKIQTSSHGFGLTIPITPYLGVYLGRRKTRYWSDETVNVNTHGVLDMTWAPSPDGLNPGFNTNGYDTYHVYDNADYNMITHPDAREALGGTFPDNDYYNVTGQGIGGNIRPYVFQEELYIQNDVFNSSSQVKQWTRNITFTTPYYQNPTSLQYRFVNDFSNRYTQTSQPFVFDANNYIEPAFDAAPVHGKGDGNTGYFPAFQQLAGSKHIEYINNINMLPGTAHTSGMSASKFYDPIAPGFVRRGSTNGGTELENSFNYQIGGYQVTNESGVTYHYMLPAYTGNEYVYTRANGNDGTFNMQTKTASYAYAWYLTAVTGPDYVDANNNGIVDEGDWGYWVSFEYGKWCDNFVWRNPETGYQKDLDNGFEEQSAGLKELYYLNKIKTATHTALFEKALRNDGKGVSSVTTNSAFGNYPLYNSGFDATSKGTMRLNRVFILNNSDADALSPAAGSVSGHYAQNVYDAADIPASLSGNAIRVIQFNHDYSLCAQTPNSYDYSSPTVKTGKLTLNSVEFKGKGGLSVMPPVYFSYDVAGSDQKHETLTTTVNGTSGQLTNPGTNLYAPGDILDFTIGATTYYCVVTAVNASSHVYTVTYFNGVIPSGVNSVAAVNTKNPPYNKDNYDMWNMLKTDFDPNKPNGENAARAVSPVSSAGTDAWALRWVTSSLGGKIKIDYEPDSYGNPVLEAAYNIQIYSYSVVQPSPPWTNFPLMQYNSPTDNIFWYRIRNPESMTGYTLNVGDRFDAIMFQRTFTNAGPGGNSYTGYDTKANGAYLQVRDLSYYASSGIVGFQLNNIAVYATAPVTTDQSINNPYPIGNLRFQNPNIAITHFGGGVRVKALSLIDPASNRTTRTTYDYSDPNTGLTSGVTSFEPSVFDDITTKVWDPSTSTFVDPPGLNNPAGFNANGITAYKKMLYYYNSQLLSYTRELPPPGVMYGDVTIRNEVVNPEDGLTQQAPGKTTYQFDVFNANMIGIAELSKTGPVGYPGDPGPTYNTLETRFVALKNFTSRIGNLKRTIHYDNNGKKLSETINNYLSDGLENSSFSDFDNAYEPELTPYSLQGVIQENFINIRYIQANMNTGLGARKAVNTKREEYPMIMTGQTTIDYQNQTTSSSQNLGFDFYSGALVKKLDIDPYGNRFMSVKVPAYTLSQYAAMGLKVNNSTNKNMLTQEAGNYVYQVDNSNNNLGLINASAQTWSNASSVVNPTNPSVTIVQNGGTNGNVWRKKDFYIWHPDGSTVDGINPLASFTDLNWTTPSSSVAGWKKAIGITLYDTWSHALETTDVNGNYGATVMGYNNTRVVVAGNPCRYNEIAYSGAEDNWAAVTPGSGTVVTGSVEAGNVHSGVKSLSCNAGQPGFVFPTTVAKLTPGRDYMASVWVKAVAGGAPVAQLNYLIDGVTTTTSVSNRQSGTTGWYLITTRIPGASLTGHTSLVLQCLNNSGGTEYFDDFRFQPVTSTTTAYVYDPKTGELNFTLDNNNLYTRFFYDARGRLTKTYKETLANGPYKVSEHVYNYSTAPFTSAAINQSFTKNDCSPGQLGTSSTISLPAGAYTSFVSTTDATAQAMVYAQGLANAQGSCICTPTFTYNTGISSVVTQLPVNGTRVNFTFVFSWPAGATNFILGTLSGACALPTATRTVPITVGSSVYSLTISPTGQVIITLVSGPVPTGTVGLTGIYDTQVNLFYNVAESGSFQKTNCTPPQVGSFVTYTVQANRYAATDQTTANNLAITDVNNFGPGNANSLGTCSTPCSFTWSSGITSRFNANISTTGTTSSFNIVFGSPSNSYFGGSLGTITGGCVPSANRFVTVTDGATTSRTWNVTITNTGAVSISLGTGSAGTLSGPPIVLSGTYAQ